MRVQNDLKDVTIAGMSCLDSLQWRSSELIFCVAHVHEAGGNWTVDADLVGPVVVTLQNGNSTTSDELFTFTDCLRSLSSSYWCFLTLASPPLACYVYSSKSACQAEHQPGLAACTWCTHRATCIPVGESCGYSCSTEAMYMTCGELSGIVVTTTAVLAGSIAIAYFAYREERILSAKVAAVAGHVSRRESGASTPT